MTEQRGGRMDSGRILVTGAAGGLGSAVVDALRSRGETNLRIFVRRYDRTLTDGVAPDGTEVTIGNLGDPQAVDRAVDGTDRVIHAGAVMRGSWEEHHRGTIVGTQNVLDACSRFNVKKLTYISSMSVVQWAGESKCANVDEDSPYEGRADERGHYTRAKLEAERAVRKWHDAHELPIVILRPGQIFGGRIPLLSGAVARSVGGARLLMLGDGELNLPLVYLDDVVDAILLALDSEAANGQVIQLVDGETLTQNQVIARVRPGATVVRTPRTLVFAAGRMSEPVLRLLKKQSPVSEYRLRSAMAARTFKSDRAKTLLGWVPRVGVSEGIRRVLAAETNA